MREICQEGGTRQSLYATEGLSKKDIKIRREYNLRSLVKTSYDATSYWLWNNKTVTLI